MVIVPTHIFKAVLAERGSLNGSKDANDAVIGASVLPKVTEQSAKPLVAWYMRQMQASNYNQTHLSLCRTAAPTAPTNFFKLAQARQAQQTAVRT